MHYPQSYIRVSKEQLRKASNRRGKNQEKEAKKATHQLKQEAEKVIKELEEKLSARAGIEGIISHLKRWYRMGVNYYSCLGFGSVQMNVISSSMEFEEVDGESHPIYF